MPQRARALRELPHRVAIDGDAAARERIAALLGDRARVVPLDAADVLIVDTPAGERASPTFDDALPTIVLVDAPRAESAAYAVRAGAAAVLSRRADAPELLAAIAAVAVGLFVVDASARTSFAISRASSDTTEALTERERDVLALLARGLSNKRIGARLGISEHTAKFHVGSVLAKLGAATRAEAVALGVRRGEVML